MPTNALFNDISNQVESVAISLASDRPQTINENTFNMERTFQIINQN